MSSQQKKVVIDDQKPLWSVMKPPRLFFVDDDKTALYGYKRYFENSEYQITCAETLQEAKGVIASERFDAILLDLQLPDGNSLEWIPELKASHPAMPIIILTGMSDVPTAVNAIKCGAENFLIKPVAMDALKVILQRCLELESVRKRDHIQQRLNTEKSPYFGKNKVMAALMEQARIVAISDAVVLLLGETGTGKGVLARWVHSNSERKTDVFIEVNCSSLKGDILKSELFGHAKGAFTSAVAAKQGLIELADGGTLFFDEIGDMDLEVQAQLLKTLEEKTFRRLGENTLRKSDFRLICATNRDLKTETKEFRRDLYYRICTFPITLPPLRHRLEEIPGLAEYFLKNSGYTHFPLEPDILQILTDYPWPGNTREFKNVLERALLLAQGEPLAPLHFPDLSAKLAHEESQAMDSMEDAHILQVLEKFNGDKRKTCKALGLSISSLYRRLAKIIDSQQLSPQQK
jgi:DNA-binding NtrC family response regulator